MPYQQKPGHARAREISSFKYELILWVQYRLTGLKGGCCTGWQAWQGHIEQSHTVCSSMYVEHVIGPSGIPAQGRQHTSANA